MCQSRLLSLLQGEPRGPSGYHQGSLVSGVGLCFQVTLGPTEALCSLWASVSSTVKQRKWAGNDFQGLPSPHLHSWFWNRDLEDSISGAMSSVLSATICLEPPGTRWCWEEWVC